MANDNEHSDEQEEDLPGNENGNDAGISRTDGKDEETGTSATPKKRRRKRKRKAKAAPNNDIEQTSESVRNSLDHTVFVEGIPFDCNEEQVRHFFSSNGINDLVELRLPVWQDTGRLRGFGHVVFASTQSRSKALELSGEYLEKRYLTIQEPKEARGTGGRQDLARPRDQPPGCRIVFVKNLPYSADEKDIRRAFQIHGDIAQGGVRIARNYQTRQSKGFAYVEFEDTKSAYKAVHARTHVMSRLCLVDYDDSGIIKGSFKTESGQLWRKEYGKKKQKR